MHLAITLCGKTICFILYFILYFISYFILILIYFLLFVFGGGDREVGGGREEAGLVPD